MEKENLNIREDLFWLCFINYIETYERTGIFQLKKDKQENIKSIS